MSSKSDLKIDWCNHKAAKYAVEHWHYSRCLPRFKRVYLGVWESNRFIGAIVFGNGASPQIADPFGLKRHEVAELTRVALRSHRAPVTRIVAIAIKMLRRHSPGLKVIVSFADPEQGHRGAIYQAGNWTYLGVTKGVPYYFDAKTGKRIHSKTLATGRRGYVTQLVEGGHVTVKNFVKHKYAMAFDPRVAKLLASQAKPYPKCAGSAVAARSTNQSEGGGATPTSALQSSPVPTD